jgi:hypothetical protein
MFLECDNKTLINKFYQNSGRRVHEKGKTMNLSVFQSAIKIYWIQKRQNYISSLFVIVLEESRWFRELSIPFDF